MDAEREICPRCSNRGYVIEIRRVIETPLDVITIPYALGSVNEFPYIATNEKQFVAPCAFCGVMDLRGALHSAVQNGIVCDHEGVVKHMAWKKMDTPKRMPPVLFRYDGVAFDRRFELYFMRDSSELREEGYEYSKLMATGEFSEKKEGPWGKTEEEARK